MRLTKLLVGLVLALGIGGHAQASEFSRPWRDADVAIVLDPFQGNAIDWDKLATDTRVAGMIHRATIGMNSDSKYTERRGEAKDRGLKWGSYHLLTTADPENQVDNYLSVTGTEAAETYAIDIECLSVIEGCAKPSMKVSIAQIEVAVRRFKEKTGRLPLIYANGSVTSVLAEKLAGKPELSGIKLWYARYKSTLDNFPQGIWTSYTLWQFSSEINCNPPPGTCPHRVPGTKFDMDINVYNGTVAELRAAWPLN